MTGIATAYMDSIPIVAITGNVPVPLLGKDSFQEVDIAGITMPITKHNFIVKDITKLADTIRRAFRIAKTGRPGPVLIDIAKDVTAAKLEYESKKPIKIMRVTAQITEDALNEASKMISEAQKPMIFVGGGAVISEAEEELKEFVDKVDAPVTDSLMGKGAFDGNDPRYTGMLGMHGTKTSNLSVKLCCPHLMLSYFCCYNSISVCYFPKSFNDVRTCQQIWMIGHWILFQKTVVNIAGDGCFRMNMNEIATAVRYEIPFLEIIFNNHVLGMVRQWQTLFYEKRYSHTILNDGVDYVKVAQAMGAEAFRITKKEEVEDVLRQAIALNKPVVIDCILDCDDKVWPMVAPGAAIEECFAEEDLK